MLFLSFQRIWKMLIKTPNWLLQIASFVRRKAANLYIQPSLAGSSFSLDLSIIWSPGITFFFNLNQVIQQMCWFSSLTALLFLPPPHHRSLGLHEWMQGAGTLGPVLEPLSDAAQHEHGLWTASVNFLQDSFASPRHQEGKLLPGPLA